MELVVINIDGCRIQGDDTGGEVDESQLVSPEMRIMFGQMKTLV